MDTAVSASSRALRLLPAQRHDAAGRAHVDYRSVLALAWPFVLNSSVQAILNLTDTWFIGRLSTQALAAMGAVYWLVLVFVLLLGGVGIAVQTLVAQANGGRRWRTCGAGGVDRAMGSASHGAAVSRGGACGCRHTASIRARARSRAPSAAVLGATHARCADRRRTVGGPRVLQRHCTAARHARDHAAGGDTQCIAQPALHLRPWHGNRRFGMGHERGAAERLDRGDGAVPRAESQCTLSLAADVAIAAGTVVAPVPARIPDGTAVRRGSARHRAVPDHDGASRQRRWRGDADRHDADVDRLSAGSGLCHDRHHSRRPVDRRGRQGVGDAARQRHDQALGRLYGVDRSVPRRRPGPGSCRWFVSPPISTLPRS